jgi:outer membrane protein assembly factor BamC
MSLFRYASLPLLLVLVACGNVEELVPDRRPDYRTSQIGNPLEIPPDLTTSTIDDSLVVPDLGASGDANLSDYTRERQGGTRAEVVAREPEGMRIERSGDRRWLVVDRPPESIWPQVKEFWLSNGFPLSREDPRIGVIETDWLENRADIPDGPVRAVLSRFLDFAYSAPTRDRFLVRLERTSDGTEVFLTHFGVEEIVRTPSGRATTSQSSFTTWQNRPRDPELEAEMLSRLMVYLGASEQRARQELTAASESPESRIQTRLIEDSQGNQALLVGRPYDEAWRLVGLALDSERFVVEDQNRAEGLYLVEYRSTTEGQRSTGLLSTLAFWRDDEMQNIEPGERFKVRLAGQGPQTLVVVHDLQDQVDNSAEGLALLDTLQQAFQ